MDEMELAAIVEVQERGYFGPMGAKGLRWPRLFGQISRFDKWNVCRG
jgi:hypothetical protein